MKNSNSGWTEPAERSFYAVKMRSGLVMCFEWDPRESAEAMLNRNVMRVLHCVTGVSQDRAEEEATRIFETGGGIPSMAAQQEGQK